jgi:hypothetical protein
MGEEDGGERDGERRARLAAKVHGASLAMVQCES